MSLEDVIEDLLDRIASVGPDRVMVSEDESWSAARARERGIVSDVVFVRDDGWTLGAPAKLEDAACRQWIGDWAYVTRRPFERLDRT